MRYLPFTNGKYSTSPGLLSLSQAETPADKLVFQVDDNYLLYLQNKKDCRAENINKYYTQAQLDPVTSVAVNQYLVFQLVKEHPELFNFNKTASGFELYNRQTGERVEWQADWLETKKRNYLTLFDAICSQVQEDIAVCQLAGNQDWLAALHLCAPNHWAAQDKIGKHFNAVHAAIPAMENTKKHYFKMLELLVHKGPYSRFAWGIATDNRLNHHPEPPPHQNPDLWQGRQLGPETEHLFVRVERQITVGLPKVNAFVFTIRTFFYDIMNLQDTEKKALLTAVKSMSLATLQYKGLAGKMDVLEERLA